MKHRLLTLAIVLALSLVSAAPASAGFGSSPGRHTVLDQEMEHGRSNPR